MEDRAHGRCARALGAAHHLAHDDLVVDFTRLPNWSSASARSTVRLVAGHGIDRTRPSTGRGHPQRT